jgi:hypothetical protein
MAGSSWWKEVSGPNRFIGAVADSAMAQKSVILSVPGELPFEDEFFIRLTEQLQESFSGHQVAILKGITGSPAQYFLSKCCKPEVRATFRPKPNFTAADFLAVTKSATLHGACYIVDPGDASEIPEWIDFISSYIKALRSPMQPAVFVLLSRSRKPKAFKGIWHIDYGDYTTHFDTYAYCAIKASDVKEPEIIKTYLAELAAAVSGGNTEEAEKAIYIYREFLSDPIGFAARHFRNDRQVPDEKMVWEAQLKCIFPFLERYRCDFVERHAREIEPHLPLPNPVGNDFEKASDVELGALLFMASSGMIQIPTEEYMELKRFAYARNDLAHLESLSYDDIRLLIA